jgi:hypothetical protein
MGYRLHYGKKYQVEWSGGFFNRCSEVWDNFLEIEFGDYWVDENQCEYEISKQQVENYIEKIEELGLERKNEYFGEYTNREIAEILTEILLNADSENEYIRLAWY